MTFRPLFFLPRPALGWAYEQAYAEKLMKHWVVRAIFCSVDSLGVEFPYKGDTLIWLWPWKRKGDPRPFISVLMSGTGEWGDAKYSSLVELDHFSKMLDEAVQPLVDRIQDEIDKKCVGILVGRAIEDSRWNEETQSWEVEVKIE